jgi:hypothetical protein
VRPRVESIAARLLAATGNEVRRLDGPAGIRLEVDVPADLSENSRSFVISALADADNYGHERTEDADYAWALISPGDTP